MRFDDMLATVLAQPLETAAARVVAWRQVVDLIAQRRAAEPTRGEALALLRRLRPELPIDVRAEAARSLAGQRLPPELILLFADEPSAIQRPLVATARLEAGDWLFLLPQLPPVTRGLLRHRRDLPAAVARALDSFGASDFALGSPEEGTPQAALEAKPSFDGEAQIRDLMARIEAFRRTAAELPVEAETEEAEPRIEEFRFETGGDGIVQWVDRGPRGALIGISIATAADPLDHGVDGHAAGAYRRRAPFRDARLTVAGAGPAAGEWRISAVPFFDPDGGRFTGYRGTARRPRHDESATPTGRGTGLHGSGLPADSLRQLIHELRTPLNAIVGFGEMIERQLLGPVAEGYRARAADIVAQGRRLLATVDDLDLSARVETRRLALDVGPVDPTLLLARLQGDYAGSAAERGVVVEVAIGDAVPPVLGDPVAVERMFARLLAATVGLAGAGERVHIRLDGGGDADRPQVRFRVTRPASLAGREERLLLDPGYSPEGDWPDAPLLGLGFALRLVRSLAAAAGGRLDIESDAFLLSLPGEGGAALSGSGRR